VSFRLTQLASLDGLRGIAILAVMLNNARYLPGGFLGVDIFFVLSGFLITALLLQEWQRTGTIRLGAFYARRALRLLPALFALLAVVLPVALPDAGARERSDRVDRADLLWSGGTTRSASAC
jgi:peptidoglycan/LPS O-acetylase OafA/YrhL